MIPDFSNDDDSDYIGDLEQMTEGTNGCRGSLAIIHSMTGPQNTDQRTRTFRPYNYKNIIRLFRRRQIARVEVWGNCPWRLYRQRRFRGAYVTLQPGFSSHLNMIPRSIAQLN